jgi:hypothetical protein
MILKDKQKLAQVKSLPRSNYYGDKETCKYFASLSHVDDIFSPSQFSFDEFIDKIAVIDNNLLLAADVSIKFVGTANKITFKTSLRNFITGLLMFELLECLVRIADKNYLKKGMAVATDHLQAV